MEGGKTRQGHLGNILAVISVNDKWDIYILDMWVHVWHCYNVHNFRYIQLTSAVFLVLSHIFRIVHHNDTDYIT